MIFRVDKSFDRSEINHIFSANIAPEIGAILTIKGRVYELTDIEIATDMDNDGYTTSRARGLLARVR